MKKPFVFLHSLVVRHGARMRILKIFNQISKGTLLTVEGYFKPEEWTDKDGVKHNRVIMVATKFYPAVDKEDTSTK